MINGGQGLPAGGTITFNLYGPSATPVCSGGNLVFTSAPIPVTGDGMYNSGNFVPTVAGTYYWVAAYTGDSPNTNSRDGVCGASNETVVVSPLQPSITTQASGAAGVPVGTAINDVATLGGVAAGAGGTITFTLFGPNNATCTGNPIFTSTKNVSGAGQYTSDNFTTTAPGTYRWIASVLG